MSLADLIHKKIKKYGPISIADYMELCLAHPEFGYYMRRDPLGAAGDFITAPEISQIFGELIGLWLAHQWEKLGKPECALVELGPGRGTLMTDALRATKKIKGFHEAVSVHLVEMSPALKQKQWHALAGKHSAVEWHDRIDTLPDMPWLLVANEFFDALPIQQFIYQDGWKERMVGSLNGKLEFVIASQAKQSSSAASAAQGPYTAPTALALDCDVACAPRNDDIRETCPDAIAITKSIASHIAKYPGAAIIVDYGYTEGSRGDTLQALKNHAYHDVLRDPGEADLTAHVDFASLARIAAEAGTHVFGPTPQGKFLMKIGAGHRLQTLCAQGNDAQNAGIIAGLERLASPDQMGDLFKVLAITSPEITQVEGF